VTAHCSSRGPRPSADCRAGQGGGQLVHPVIVGKRALPQISLTNDVEDSHRGRRAIGVADICGTQIRYVAAFADYEGGTMAELDGHCYLFVDGTKGNESTRRCAGARQPRV